MTHANRWKPSSAASARVLALAGALIGVVGCDPCFGVASCTGSPRLAIEGTLVEQAEGNPISGARIDVIRTAGTELASDSASAVTGEDGHWQLSIDARALGDVIVDINVSPPSVAQYRVRGVHFTTSDRRGAGYVLPTWVSDPHFAYAAELYFRSSQDVRVGGATVEFHRTGGINYYAAVVNQIYSAQTDAAGRVALFDINAHAIGLGDLIGDLVVRLPAPLKPDTVRGLRLTPTQLLVAPTQIIRIGTGP